MTEEQNIPWNDLLERVKAGQSQARDLLCRELSVRLMQVAKYRLWGWPRQDLEDIVQECLCTFLQKLDQIHSNPEAYACEILRHKVGNALQKRKILKVALPPEFGEESQWNQPTPHHNSLMKSDGSPLAHLESGERLGRVCEAILNLPDFCRNFFMGLMENCSVHELWTLFSQREPTLQRGTFDKRIFDCRRRLRQLVGDEA